MCFHIRVQYCYSSYMVTNRDRNMYHQCAVGIVKIQVEHILHGIRIYPNSYDRFWCSSKSVGRAN